MLVGRARRRRSLSLLAECGRFGLRNLLTGTLRSVDCEAWINSVVRKRERTWLQFWSWYGSYVSSLSHELALEPNNEIRSSTVVAVMAADLVDGPYLVMAIWGTIPSVSRWHSIRLVDHPPRTNFV